MANLPLTVRVSRIPSTFKGDINDFAQALAARMKVESSSPASLFSTGTVLPTSDVGPFWKEDTREWYGWDTGTGTYIAQTIDPASRGYIAQVAPGPNQANYVFWIEIDGAGKAKSIRYYSGGAWKDVYEDKFAQYSTTAQMNSAISAAVGGSSASAAPVEAFINGGSQSVTANETPVKLILSSELLDPESRWDTTDSDYTAPSSGVYELSAWAQLDNDDAVASGVEALLSVYVNNVQYGAPEGVSIASPPGSRWYPRIAGKFISLSENDVVDVRLSVGDGVGTGAVTVTHARVSIKKIA